MRIFEPILGEKAGSLRESLYILFGNMNAGSGTDGWQWRETIQGRSKLRPRLLVD